MKHFSGALWVFGFALIALLWVPIRSLDLPEFGKPEPAPTYVSPEPAPTESPDGEVPDFCKDPRHVDSVACKVNPGTTTSSRSAGSTQTRTIRVGSGEDRTRETRVIEKQQTTTRTVQPDPDPPASNNQPLDIPKIPEVEIPKIPDRPDVPEVEVPMVGKVDVDEQLDSLLK